MTSIIHSVLAAYCNHTINQPFIIGITGSSCAGKTTLSVTLQKDLQQHCPTKTITVIQADNFIYPNAWLEANHLMSRKGFPESFDHLALKNCLEALHHPALLPIHMPCYSQDLKDIMPDKKIMLERSDLYIIEGVNLFFSYPDFHAIHFIDFSIYLEPGRDIIKQRALKRFFDAYEKSKITPAPYFGQFRGWSEEAIQQHAERLWETMDMFLLREYIEPHHAQADLIVHAI